jgi:hypothetical protein
MKSKIRKRIKSKSRIKSRTIGLLNSFSYSDSCS